MTRGFLEGLGEGVGARSWKRIRGRGPAELNLRGYVQLVQRKDARGEGAQVLGLGE